MRTSSFPVGVSAPVGVGHGVARPDRRRRAGAVVGGVVAGAVLLGMMSSGEARLFWAVPVVALLGGAVLVARGELAR